MATYVVRISRRSPSLAAFTGELLPLVLTERGDRPDWTFFVEGG